MKSFHIFLLILWFQSSLSEDIQKNATPPASTRDDKSIGYNEPIDLEFLNDLTASSSNLYEDTHTTDYGDFNTKDFGDFETTDFGDFLTKDFEDIWGLRPQNETLLESYDAGKLESGLMSSWKEKYSGKKSLDKNAIHMIYSLLYPYWGHWRPAIKFECPYLYTKVGDTCLSISCPMDPLGWDEARLFCKMAKGGHLASFNSDKELELARKFVKDVDKTKQCSYWIGASDEDSEGTWKWISNKALPMESPGWGKSRTGYKQPDGGSKENYAFLNREDYYHIHDANDWSDEHDKIVPLCQVVPWSYLDHENHDHTYEHIHSGEHHSGNGAYATTPDHDNKEHNTQYPEVSHTHSHENEHGHGYGHEHGHGHTHNHTGASKHPFPFQDFMNYIISHYENYKEGDINHYEKPHHQHGHKDPHNHGHGGNNYNHVHGEADSNNYNHGHGDADNNNYNHGLGDADGNNYNHGHGDANGNNYNHGHGGADSNNHNHGHGDINIDNYNHGHGHGGNEGSYSSTGDGDKNIIPNIGNGHNPHYTTQAPYNKPTYSTQHNHNHNTHSNQLGNQHGGDYSTTHHGNSEYEFHKHYHPSGDDDDYVKIIEKTHGLSHGDNVHHSFHDKKHGPSSSGGYGGSKSNIYIPSSGVNSDEILGSYNKEHSAPNKNPYWSGNNGKIKGSYNDGHTGPIKNPYTGGISDKLKGPYNNGHSGLNKNPYTGGNSDKSKRPYNNEHSGPNKKPYTGGNSEKLKGPYHNGHLGPNKNPHTGGNSDKSKRPSINGHSTPNKTPNTGQNSGETKEPNTGDNNSEEDQKIDDNTSGRDNVSSKYNSEDKVIVIIHNNPYHVGPREHASRNDTYSVTFDTDEGNNQENDKEDKDKNGNSSNESTDDNKSGESLHSVNNKWKPEYSSHGGWMKGPDKTHKGGKDDPEFSYEYRKYPSYHDYIHQNIMNLLKKKRSSKAKGSFIPDTYAQSSHSEDSYTQSSQFHDSYAQGNPFQGSYPPKENNWSGHTYGGGNYKAPYIQHHGNHDAADYQIDYHHGLIQNYESGNPTEHIKSAGYFLSKHPYGFHTAFVGKLLSKFTEYLKNLELKDSEHNNGNEDTSGYEHQYSTTPSWNKPHYTQTTPPTTRPTHPYTRTTTRPTRPTYPTTRPTPPTTPPTPPTTRPTPPTTRPTPPTTRPTPPTTRPTPPPTRPTPPPTRPTPPTTRPTPPTTRPTHPYTRSTPWNTPPNTPPPTPWNTPPNTPPPTIWNTPPNTLPPTPWNTPPNTPPPTIWNTPTNTFPTQPWNTSPNTSPPIPWHTPPDTPPPESWNTPPNTPSPTRPTTQPIHPYTRSTPWNTPPNTPPPNPWNTPPNTPPPEPWNTPPNTTPTKPWNTPPNTTPPNPWNTPPNTPPPKPWNTPPNTTPTEPWNTPPNTPPSTPWNTPPNTPPPTSWHTPPNTDPPTTKKPWYITAEPTSSDEIGNTKDKYWSSQYPSKQHYVNPNHSDIYNPGTHPNHQPGDNEGSVVPSRHEYNYPQHSSHDKNHHRGHSTAPGNHYQHLGRPTQTGSYQGDIHSQGNVYHHNHGHPHQNNHNHGHPHQNNHNHAHPHQNNHNHENHYERDDFHQRPYDTGSSSESIDNYEGDGYDYESGSLGIPSHLRQRINGLEKKGSFLLDSKLLTTNSSLAFNNSKFRSTPVTTQEEIRRLYSGRSEEDHN